MDLYARRVERPPGSSGLDSQPGERAAAISETTRERRGSALGVSGIRPPALGLASAAMAPSLLAAAIVILGFSSGGFFARTQGLAVIVGATATIGVVAFAPGTLGRVRGPLLLALVAVSALAGWTLLSAQWSGSEARALIEFERVVLYALALVLFGLLAKGARSVVHLLAAVDAAFLVLCLAGLAMRLLPDVFTFGVDQRLSRLQYPLTYANALGLLAALGAILSFAFAAGAHRSPAAKILGAATTPVFVTTLLLTYSRGPMVAGAVGLIIFLVAGSSRSTAGAVLATAGPAGAAAYAAYHGDRLAANDFVSARAISQGHREAVILVTCVVLAAALRAAALVLDRRLERLALARAARPTAGRAKVIAAGVLVVVLATIVVASNLPALQRGYERFGAAGSVQSQDVRARLTDVQGNDRVQAWHVALADFRSSPILGRGAGTFVLSWDRSRTVALPFNETHSIYMQMLGEIGAVGFALLLLGLGTILVGMGLCAREPGRVMFAAALGGGVAWAVAAGVDWQWQMPVVTLWLFAVAGSVLGSCREPRRVSRPHARWLAVLALAGVALLPARVAQAEGQVTKALLAFRATNCRTATAAAEAARSALDALPAPFLLLGYCAFADHKPTLAVRYAKQAIARDPENWTYHYALANIRGAAGVDPRAEARAALRLNPLEPQVRAMVRTFRGVDPRGWQQQAAAVRLVLPSPFD